MKYVASALKMKQKSSKPAMYRNMQSLEENISICLVCELVTGPSWNTFMMFIIFMMSSATTGNS